MSKKKQTNEHIQVFIRCRPLLKSELCLPVPVEVHPEVNKILVRDSGTDKCSVKSFTFDKVFGPNAKQADIYTGVVAPKIREVIMGFNCTIFAYGQTGTGKTFTIEGGRTPNIEDVSEDPLSGIIPRSMKHLFTELTEQNMKFEICVSFLELYNEEIFDLLSRTDDPVKLRMFDNAALKGSIIVQGLEVRPVTSMKEVYDILDIGFKKRRKATTLLNKASSRSHTVFTVTVNLKESSSTFEKVKTGKLNLVDLAGSENIGRSGASDKRAREAGNINQSLLALGRVITSLCENAGHIPYRESKLTRLLQDSLGGQTKTAVIATISPSAVHIDETLNTLEYALRAKNITNRPELNTQVAVTTLTKDYMEEIIRLRREIHEFATKNGFYVPEENLKHWESTLASKREEKYKILSQLNDLTEEEKSLDTAIQEASNIVTERKNHLDSTKLRCEDLRQELEKEKKDEILHEAMLKVMQPLHDHLHEKLHTEIEENRELELDVTKMKMKLKSSVEELQNLREEHQSKCDRWRERNEQAHLNAENFWKNVKNMHHSGSLLTSDCNKYVSVLKRDFESVTNLCENEFKNIFKATNDLKAMGESFQENMESVIGVEKSTKLKSIDECFEAYLTSKESSVLEPASNIMKDCETSLLGIASALNDLKCHISSDMETRQNLMNEHLNNQKNTLDSMTNSAKALLKVQKENLDEYNNIAMECVNSVSVGKTLWNDQFLSVELVLSSLDLFCTDRIKNEVDKATQVNSLIMSCSRAENEISEKLTLYRESSVKNIDAVQNEIDLHDMNVFSSKWEEMKKRVDISSEKYKCLNSELARISRVCQDVDGIARHVEDSLKTKFKAVEQPTVSYSQEMLDSILKWGNSNKTYLVENHSKIDALLSNDKIHNEKLKETSKQLSSSLNDSVPSYIQCIETDFKNFFATENDAESSDSTINNTLFDANITITSTEYLENTTKGNECPICVDKISDRTLQADENVFHATEAPLNAKIPLKSPPKFSNDQPEASGSKSFMSTFPPSPVRRPRNRNIPPARRNLQFLDVEKLAYQLLQSSSDEEQ